MLKKWMQRLSKDREVKSLAILILIMTVILFSAKGEQRLLFILGVVFVWALYNWWHLYQKNVSPSESLPVDNGSDAIMVACHHVQEKTAAAVKFLKERLASQSAGIRAFYAMPWYLLIGPSGAGKTALLAKSDMGFLETESFVQFTPAGMKTNSGVNWWFATNAVLLDVPGAYLDEPNELTPFRAAWLELIRQIRYYRPRKPINGIIVTIDIETLQKTDLTSEASPLRFIRARLEEAMHRLKQHFPIYLVCTQADKLQGFTEFFDDMGKSERQQNWGITFALKQQQSWPALFQKQFDQFILRLHQRVLWRIHQERDQHKRYLIQHFPHQITQIKENLQRLVYELSALSTKLSLRGVYFTSAEQDDRPAIDPIADTLSKNFSLLPITQPANYFRPQQAFFVKQLFTQKILPESALANSSAQTLAPRYDQWIRFSALGFAGALLLSATVSWTHHYQQQTLRLNTTSAALADYKLLALAYNPANPPLNKLLPALNALRLAKDSAKAANLPWLLRFQLHYQQPLSTLTTQLYQRALQTQLAPAIRANIAQQLQTTHTLNAVQMYGLFQAYLMLGDPTHADPAWLKQWFHHMWQSPLAADPSFMRHVDALLSAVTVLQSDPAFVTQARAMLNALPYPLLGQAILDNSLPSTVVQPVDDPEISRYFNLPAQGIAGAYTAAQFNALYQHIDTALAEAISGNWVLGDKQSMGLSSADIAQLRQGLIDQYAEDYASAWQDWLSNIQLKPSATLNQLEITLQTLISQRSPLIQLLTTTVENTRVPGILQSKLSTNVVVIDQLLTTATIKTILTDIQQLQTQLHPIVISKNPGADALQLLAFYQANQNRDAIHQLLLLANTLPWPISAWLNTLADNARDLLLQQAQAYITSRWQQQVMPMYKTQLAGRYPLIKTASADVALNQFEAFFKPKGIIDQYVDNTIAPFIDTTQARWQWRIIEGKAFSQDNNFLMQIERAAIIQKLYFNNKNQLSASFTLKLISTSDNVKSAILKVGNHWPMQTKTITLNVTDQSGKTHRLTTTGEWALFKLLDIGKLTSQPDGQTFNVDFTLGNTKLHYQLNAASLLNPFVPGVIDQFNLIT